MPVGKQKLCSFCELNLLWYWQYWRHSAFYHALKILLTVTILRTYQKRP
jgi:hypothetical protein